MAKGKHTYAVRLAVEGGNKVKAELVNVGESGERSLKKIERAGGKASLGLSSLGERARMLTTGMRALGGALVGAAAVGGLATLIWDCSVLPGVWLRQPKVQAKPNRP